MGIQIDPAVVHFRYYLCHVHRKGRDTTSAMGSRFAEIVSDVVNEHFPDNRVSSPFPWDEEPWLQNIQLGDTAYPLLRKMIRCLVFCTPARLNNQKTESFEKIYSYILTCTVTTAANSTSVLASTQHFRASTQTISALTSMSSMIQQGKTKKRTFKALDVIPEVMITDSEADQNQAKAEADLSSPEAAPGPMYSYYIP